MPSCGISVRQRPIAGFRFRDIFRQASRNSTVPDPGVRLWSESIADRSTIETEETRMPELINMGSLQLKFLHSKQETGGSLDMFEMTLQPNARMPVPHYHESWDEIVYGLTGTTTWNVDGKDVDVASGESVFIRRGVVHGF